MVLAHQEDEVDILVPPNSVATLSVTISYYQLLSVTISYYQLLSVQTHMGFLTTNS